MINASDGSQLKYSMHIDPGALKEGEKIHGYIMEEKLDMNVIVCNGVIDMYVKCSFVNKAYGVFENMFCRKSLVTWNAMIMVFAMHGDAYKALELFYANGSSRCAPGCCIITSCDLQWHIRNIVVLYR